jgi:hypothetical protein
VSVFLTDKMSALSTNEIHQIAMNLVGSQLKAAGYEFLGVNSKPGVDPQFVCTLNRELHFIVVRGFLYPADPLSPDRVLLEKVADHAAKFDAKAYWAGVGVYHPKDRKLPISKSTGYELDFKGLYLAEEVL